MPQLFANNASSTLSAGISSSATSLTVVAGDGAKFPNPGASDHFLCTLETGTTREIVQVTARAVDTFTIVRAQEGTSAQTWSAGATVELRLTKGTMERAAWVLNRDVTSAEVVSSTTETTVYSFTVPANTLSTNRMLRLTGIGDVLNNSGANTVFTVRLKYGSTTVFSASQTLATSASRRPIHVVGSVSGQNATNSQAAATLLIIETAVGVTGTSGSGTPAHTSVAVHNAIAEDSTTALALALTFQHDTNSANVSAVLRIAQLELI